MINDLTTYLLHIAPSLAVVLVLLWRTDKRLREIESKMQEMLDQCWQHFLDTHG